MAKRVVVIASGETERQALPLLLRSVADDLDDLEVRIPPNHRPIDVTMAEKLIRSVWFEREEQQRPEKFVVLLDTDASEPEDALAAIRGNLPGRIPEIAASIQFAYAQRHLEAWYFGDDRGLQRYLGRTLGRIDPSRSDELLNPKLHLKNLLTQLYTSRVAGEIAKALDARAIAQRSASFAGFVAAVRNGGR